MLATEVGGAGTAAQAQHRLTGHRRKKVLHVTTNAVSQQEIVSPKVFKKGFYCNLSLKPTWQFVCFRVAIALQMVHRTSISMHHIADRRSDGAICWISCHQQIGCAAASGRKKRVSAPRSVGDILSTEVWEDVGCPGQHARHEGVPRVHVQRRVRPAANEVAQQSGDLALVTDARLE